MSMKYYILLVSVDCAIKNVEREMVCNGHGQL